MLNVSASQDDSGNVHISICNLDPNNSEEITCNLDGIANSSSVSGRILTAEAMNEHNTFENPNKIEPKHLMN